MIHPHPPPHQSPKEPTVTETVDEPTQGGKLKPEHHDHTEATVGCNRERNHLPFTCSRIRGHKGDHIAAGLDGTVFQRWYA